MWLVCLIREDSPGADGHLPDHRDREGVRILTITNVIDQYQCDVINLYTHSGKLLNFLIPPLLNREPEPLVL